MIKKGQRQKGFVLIEILVSIVLLSAGILFLVQSLSLITKSNSQIRNNRLAFLLIDNIFNRLYSNEQISPGKVILNNQEFDWELQTSNSSDALKQITLKVTSQTANTTVTTQLSHPVIDIPE
jgi:type II secretion system protein I